MSFPEQWSAERAPNFIPGMSVRWIQRELLEDHPEVAPCMRSVGAWETEKWYRSRGSISWRDKMSINTSQWGPFQTHSPCVVQPSSESVLWYSSYRFPGYCFRILSKILYEALVQLGHSCWLGSYGCWFGTIMIPVGVKWGSLWKVNL